MTDTLKQQAISLGLCEKWQSEWGNPDECDLIDKYLRGIDFCIKNNFPTNEYIKENFHKDILHARHIFVDENFADSNPDVCVVNGSCTGNISFRAFAVGTLYARGNSVVDVEVGDFAVISIRIHDDAVVRVHNRNGKVFAYLYGGCVTGDNVIIRDRKNV